MYKVGKMKKIEIRGEFIKLEQLLKIADLVSSGGEAKSFLFNNEILVNGEVDQRRGRKLYKNDEIKIFNEIYKIC